MNQMIRRAQPPASRGTASTPIDPGVEAARAAGLPQRFEGVMLWRDDETPTFHLASVVDDADSGITHVIRGFDHRPNEQLHRFRMSL